MVDLNKRKADARYSYDDPAAPDGPGKVKETPSVRAYRLGRVRKMLKQNGVPAILLTNPVNIRYSIGNFRMYVFQLHFIYRYTLIFADGPAIVFDTHQTLGQYKGIESIDEVRESVALAYFFAGDKMERRAAVWADAIVDVLTEHLGKDLSLAIDRLDPLGHWALEKRGVRLVEGHSLVEQARMIKNDEELDLMRACMEIANRGMAEMYEMLEPGVTENALWAQLHHTNMIHGGEWIETKLLSSGHRTNPWFQNASHKPVADGEFVGFDTDLIGPNGYLADVSRTFYCGTKRPSNEQRRTYGIAYDMLQHNLSMVKPGLSFRDYATLCREPDEEFYPNRYGLILHGAGMADEYPLIPCLSDFNELTGEDVLEENMVVCVESYIGSIHGGEGVKLEEQVLITKDGYELMSDFPYEEKLVGREV